MDLTQRNLVAGADSNNIPRALSVTSAWKLQTEEYWYNNENDTLKIETAWQTYYDLLPNAITIAWWDTTTVWSWSNYDLSATWAWILHEDIKRAKAISVWGNFTQNTEVKVYVAPIDNPDENTPEYACMTVSEQSWAFVAKDWTNAVVNTSACWRIMPISANALKFYIKNTSWTSETITLKIRLIF